MTVERPVGEPERRYQHPIPSREEILAMMESVGTPLKREPLARRFGIREEQHQRALEHRLKAMVRDGQLILNRAREYCLVRHLDLVTGTVLPHRDGYGFLRPDDGSDDLYLSAREMRVLWDGDRVAARATEGERGREAHVVEILERKKKEIVGRFARDRGIDYVIEDADTRIEVLIARGSSHGAKPGDMVRVEVLEYPSARGHATGSVTKVIGRLEDPGIETELAILEHGIPAEWPEAVLAAARALPEHVPQKAKQGREDLRGLPLVTIDGADAKDFDDAVFCEPDGEGWRLIVAIADVSHYVEADTALDREARTRGTSVYFPDRVVPMLPEALSNGLCSLNPHVDRLCLACEMWVSRRGEVKRSRFFEAVMRSAARLTYTGSMELIENNKPRGKQAELKAPLGHLHDVYRAFASARKRRGAIDFDVPQTKIELDERGKVANVRVTERLTTHKIIEECMIAANVQAAKRLRAARIPTLYRVHEAPEADRLEELLLFLRTFGFKLRSPNKVTPGELAKLIDRVAGKPEAELIQTVVLKSLKQARYQPGNAGHFGLALDAYAHFTSPIRRYPDLLVHRAIKWVVTHGSAKKFPYKLTEMEQLGEHTSRCERRADTAVWDVEERLKCLYLQDRIGESFDVVVASVTPFGLFVRLSELQIDGLIHVTSLPRDYYHRDGTGTALAGERTGKTYRLTDRLRVRLTAVNVEERKIDFVPVEEESAAEPSRPAERPRGRARRRGR